VIIIEDPKMLESMEKKMSEVLKLNTYWKDRADNFEGKYHDAQRRAGYFEGAFLECGKPRAQLQPTNIPTAMDCASAWMLVILGIVVGALITFVVMK
jgi:hypothetical protein